MLITEDDYINFFPDNYSAAISRCASKLLHHGLGGLRHACRTSIIIARRRTAEFLGDETRAVSNQTIRAGGINLYKKY